MENEPTAINLTDNAIQRIQSLLPASETNNFRVYVTGGGCSGFQYGFKFDESLQVTMTLSRSQIFLSCLILCPTHISMDLH